MKELKERILLGHRVAKENMVKLGLSGPAVEAIFRKLEKQKWARTRVNVTRYQRDIRKEDGITAKTIFDVFLGLEKLGIGRIEPENGESFFVWVDPKSHTPSNEEAVNGDRLKEAYAKLFERGPTKLEGKPIHGTNHFVFPLRKDFSLILNLPIDFNQSDAERLCGFLHMFAIPGSSENKDEKK